MPCRDERVASEFRIELRVTCGEIGAACFDKFSLTRMGVRQHEPQALERRTILQANAIVDQLRRKSAVLAEKFTEHVRDRSNTAAETWITQHIQDRAGRIRDGDTHTIAPD